MPPWFDKLKTNLGLGDEEEQAEQTLVGKPCRSAGPTALPPPHCRCRCTVAAAPAVAAPAAAASWNGDGHLGLAAVRAPPSRQHHGDWLSFAPLRVPVPCCSCSSWMAPRRWTGRSA